MPKNLPKRFTDVTAARQHLEALLWADGRPCPHCGVVNESTALKGKSTRPGVYWCNACQAPFSVTVGTCYERSKVPLNTWLYATHLLCSSKKGISSQQLARMLGVTVKTAWFMSHRIREAMTPEAGTESPIGGEGQIVEADETEISPSRKSRPRPRAKNMKFVTLVERGGQVRSRDITKRITTTKEVRKVLQDNLHPASELHTDSAGWYSMSPPLAATHEAVDHSSEFAHDSESGKRVHTNSAEGFFSIFKRGLVGTYQHMGRQHLSRYLAEFDFRMNHRIKLGYTDDMRTDKALEGITGKRLTYRRINEAAIIKTRSARVHPMAQG
jgi:transposase-like protein